MEINFIVNEITLDMGRTLTEVEEFMILRQVFYDFCLRGVYTMFGENDFTLGQFAVIDKHYDEEEQPRSLLGKLFKIDSKFYDERNKVQKVLANTKMSLEIICRRREDDLKYAYLQDIVFLSAQELDAYYALLQHVLKLLDDDSEIIYPKGYPLPRRLIYYEKTPPNCTSSVSKA